MPVLFLPIEELAPVRRPSVCNDDLPAPEVQRLLSELNRDIYRRLIARAIDNMAGSGWGDAPPVDFAAKFLDFDVGTASNNSASPLVNLFGNHPSCRITSSAKPLR